MSLRRAAGRKRSAGRRGRTAALLAAAALLLMAAAGTTGQRPAGRQAAQTAPQAAPPAVTPPEPLVAMGQSIEERSARYDISAHLFILGNVGKAGSMTLESAVRKQGERLGKSLRMSGSSTPEQVKKNRDFRGDFSSLKTYPLLVDGSVSGAAAGGGPGLESASTGFLKTNKKYQAEKTVYFWDHAVTTRESGTERRIEGSYGSILSPLEYLMEHDLKVGQVFETPFLLNGVPRVFRCEVTGLDNFSDFKSRAYKVDIWAVEKTTGADRAPKDVWKKKGNVRVWFCKDGPYRNQMLRLKIKFRWYLWLYFDLKK